MQICCINYNFRPIGTTGVATTNANKAGFMQVYPNPTMDNLTIAYQMKTKEKVTITVYDIMGRKIAEWHPEFTDNTKLCTFKIEAAQMRWSAGNYLIHLSNGKETYKSKLIITK